MDWTTWFESKGIVQSLIANAIWFVVIAIFAGSIKLWRYLSRVRKSLKEEREKRQALRQESADQLKKITSTPVGSPARLDALFWADFQIGRLQRILNSLHSIEIQTLIVGVALFALFIGGKGLASFVGFVGIIVSAIAFGMLGRLESEVQDHIHAFEKVVADTVVPAVLSSPESTKGDEKQ